MPKPPKTCPTCRKLRGDEELFPEGAPQCLLCDRKAERAAAGMLNRSAKQYLYSSPSDKGPRSPRVPRGPKLTDEEKYRRDLESAGYFPEQVEMYINNRFRNPTNDSTPV